MKPCISQAMTMPCSFADDVANCADAGCSALEVWLTKLEQHLAAHSLEETRQVLAERPVVLAAASYQGGLLLSQGDARQASDDGRCDERVETRRHRVTISAAARIHRTP